LTEGQDARPIGRTMQGRTNMAFKLNHVHLKTRDPAATIQFYIDNFGATMKAKTETGFNLDLDGLQLNVTDINAAQKHEQHYGIEHIAVNTADYPGTLEHLRKQGVRILEELPREAGRRVCFVEAPDGAQMEVIERL
jgi:catechol 2,3-dioxygenase-like lactoylglutathione lyase family enzyme